MAISALSTPAYAQVSRFLQCVTYARAVSGVELRGDAYSWWGQAEGRYDRGNAPRVGAVMAMPSFAGMRSGHVAMVSKIVSDREVLIDHANWSRPGMVERNVRVIEVSEKGDWSRVRVWHAGSGDLGITSYPVSGFI
jgi:surface antigen